MGLRIVASISQICQNIPWDKVSEDTKRSQRKLLNIREKMQIV